MTRRKRVREASSSPAARSAHPRSSLARALAVGAWLTCGAMAARLAMQAARGVFATDECFHAFASAWLLEHRSLPVEFPQFYSGFFYYYHPFLHALGAVWSAAFGAASLHVLPATLFAAMLAVLASGAWGAIPPRAGRWAALACASSVTLGAYAVRFYVDILVGLEFALAIALVFHLRDSGRVRHAVALGIVTGAALLTKFNGIGLPALLLAIALADLARGRRPSAGRFAMAAAIGLAIAAPWYARNQALYGSALYPVGAPDLDHALYALNRAKFSSPPAAFLARMPQILGPWIGAFALVTLGAAAWRRRAGLREGVVVAGLLGMLATAFTPMGADRHLVPYLVMIAAASAWAVHNLALPRRTLALSIDAGLLLATVFAVATLPDLRRAADLPSPLGEAFSEVRAHTPPEARILSLWTYDTYFYTGRAATWPNPWGQREHPVAMFHDTDPDSCLAHLRRSRIDYVLLPRVSRDLAFDSANYPATFLRCMNALVLRDTTRVVWASRAVALVRVEGAGP